MVEHASGLFFSSYRYFKRSLVLPRCESPVLDIQQKLISSVLSI